MKTLPIDSGFTLVEMLVVLAVVSILLAVGLPFSASMGPRIQMASASQQLLTDLREARREAVRSKKTRVLVFHPSRGEYEWHPHVRRLPSAITVSLDAEPVESPVLRFYGDGSGDPAVITLSGGKLRAVIRVEWLTGKARLNDG